MFCRLHRDWRPLFTTGAIFVGVEKSRLDHRRSTVLLEISALVA